MKDLASVGSVTVCGAANSIHVPPIRVTSSMESVKMSFNIQRLFPFLSDTQKTAVSCLPPQTYCVVHPS